MTKKYPLLFTKKSLFLLIVFSLCSGTALLQAQNSISVADSIQTTTSDSVATTIDTASTPHKKQKISLKDSLDGQVDLSDALINAHGFIPLPTIITEPALGGFGISLAAIFMEKPKAKKEGEKSAPSWPTVFGVGGLYTLNNSWGVGGGYMKEFEKIGLRFSGGLAYADMNMDFYHTFPNLNNKEISETFNFKGVPVFLSVRKNFLQYFSAGIKYMFSYLDISLDNIDTTAGHPYFNELFGQVDAKKINSQLTPVISFDNRDNVFTPNKGVKIDAQLDWADDAIGSDFDYLQAHIEGFGYINPLSRWVAGLRLDWQQMFNDAPFYLLPFINLRGVPSARYQGSIVGLAEMEHRVNFYKRWSVVGFAGVGKAFDTYNDFSDADWIYNYGAGIRYLIARKFNLQMGLDVGFGPDSWGFYVVFGSSWLRD